MSEYKYKVCVRCMTYNHSGFINETFNGFYIQKTSFPVVFCIVDDASTDGEQEVLTKWSENHLLPVDGSKELVSAMPYGKLIYGKSKKQGNSLFAILLLAENHFKKKEKSPYYAE